MWHRKTEKCGNALKQNETKGLTNAEVLTTLHNLKWITVEPHYLELLGENKNGLR